MEIKAIALSLFAFAVTGCAPSLELSTNEIAENVSARLAQPPEERPNLNTEADKLSCWLEDILQKELSIDDAVAVALLNNRRLRALYAGLGVTRADLIEAGLPQNPVFSLERRFRGQALEIDVAQEFLSFFLIPLRRQVAESEFEAEKLRVTHEILNHAFEVRAAYFDLQASMQMLEMRQTIAAAFDASFDAANRLRKAGNITQLELVQEQSSAAEARLQLAGAEMAVAGKRERLNVLLGLWGDETRWKIPTRLVELPAEEIEAKGLEKKAIIGRYDLLQARAELEALAGQAGITNITAILSNVTLASHYEREPEGSSTVGPSIEFPLAIFNFGQGSRARTKALFEQAEDNYAALAVEIRSEVRAAYAKMSMARKKAQYYRTEVLPLQQQAVAETQLRYNGMFVGIFQLLEAKRRQIEAGSQYIEALQDYWLERNGLEKALGGVISISSHQVRALPSEIPISTHHHHH